MFYIVGLLLLCNFLQYCSGVQYYGDDSQETFSCRNGKSIKSIFECDNDDDCDDNSDEYYCQGKKCSKNDFQCKNKNCISRDKLCDGYFDCIDNSDEYDGCEESLKCKDQFRCSNGYCLPKKWVCDGMNDCFDGEDELNCLAIGCEIENDRYMCTNGQCISLDLACNNIFDCNDESDEGGACHSGNNTMSCSSAGCSHDCIMTPIKPICTCPHGYKLQDDRKCTDIDECAILGICDQQCVNIDGSYECICQEGYTLQSDMKTCKADGGDAMLIFSTGDKVRGTYLDSKIEFIVAEGLNQVVSVAMDDKYVYWSEKDKTIMKGTLAGKREIILTEGLHKLSDIAVDWVTGNIYFTDENNMKIGVCDNNGTYCTVLIDKKIKKPTAIVLLPTRGVMYWCDLSKKPHIAMAGMDGKNITVFVTKRLKNLNGLTIDYSNDRLYWMDTGLQTIESVQLDGTDRKIISREVTFGSTSLAVFENKIYWIYNSRNDYKNIQYCHTFSGWDPKNFDVHYSVYNDVQIYHPIMKSDTIHSTAEVSNVCLANPCSQLCLLNQNGNYTCACTLDKKLNSDGHTCRDTKDGQHIVMIGNGTFIDYYHELLGKPRITTSLTLRHITAVTYDTLSGTILASNALTDNIFRYNLTSGEIENLISMEIESLGGMAFDHIGNNLYLTNTKQKTIEVHSLTTKAKKIFYLEEQPHDIVLAPEEGVMFVVFEVVNKYRIDKMQMNGTGTKSLFVESSLLSGPKISLYYDRNEKKIFWSDQGTKCIQSSLLTGFDYQSFRCNLNAPTNLAMAGEHVFWIEHKSARLYWANKNHQYQILNDIHYKDFASQNLEISHLITSHKVTNQKEYGCPKNNGDCSHVCLPSSATSYFCACPPEMTLSADNHTCILQYTCHSGEIKCSEYNICIKWNQWCNGVKECPNGEDEPSDCKKDDSGTFHDNSFTYIETS